jgi:hypothetical protein
MSGTGKERLSQCVYSCNFKINTIMHSLSRESKSQSASQENPRVLWKDKIYYLDHMILTLNQMIPIHTFPSYFPKIYSNIIFPPTSIKSRDSSVGIALGYRLDDRDSRFRFPAVAGNFSIHHRIQNGSGAHPASYPMCTRGSFSGGKAAGA